MRAQCAWNCRAFRYVLGGNDPMCLRVVLSEVQITRIPKASMLLVASTT